MNNDLTVEQLAGEYLAAKQAEAEAVAKRRQIGELIAKAMPGPDEGTVSSKNSSLRISVTRKMTRKVDADKLSANWGELSENEQRCFKWSADLVTKTYKAMQDLQSSSTAVIARFVTTKPAATSVEVEFIETVKE
jgi:hypothetical protein